jgi:3-oxoacyl-[acyl-carrier protein] reductase
MTIQVTKMNGKVAVIAGGAGRIGFEISRRFCENGMHVAIFGSSKEKALETTGRLRECGGSCLPIECNVTDVNAVRLAMAETNDRFGGIDVVISMQGWPSRKVKISEITDEYWNGVVSSHLTGSFHMLQQAIPYLEKSPAPRVVFMASHGARTGDSDEGLAYIAAKGGIVSMTYYAAHMLAKRGITVNCIATGGIYNNYEQEEDEVELIDRIPLGRLGTPEEVAAAVWYLVSEDAGFVTGEVLNVNGGLSVG